MKVEISSVSNASEVLLALGIKTLLKEAGIGCDSAINLGGGVAEAASISAPAPAIAALPPAPAKLGKLAKRKYSRLPAESVPSTKPVKVAASRLKKQKAAPPRGEEKPHVTIRQRILDLLKTGPRTSDQVRRELGLDAEVNVTQHLYLICRDRLAVRDDQNGVYSASGNSK